MKQTDLFGNTVEQLPNLVLQEPDAQHWEDITTLLNSRCTKQDLMGYAEALGQWLKPYGSVMLARRNGRIERTEETVIMQKSNSSKYAIAHALAIVLAVDQNLRLYLDTRSPELRQLWQMVFFNIYVTHKEAKRILKTSSSLFGQKRSAYYYTSTIVWNKPELGWFSTTPLRSATPDHYGYRDNEYYITVNPLIHALLLPYIFPAAFDMDTPLPSLPEGGRWHTLSFETDSHANFQLFQGLMAQGAFPVKAKGIGLTDVKRAAKKMSLEEFFPDDSNEYRHHLRTHSYLQLLALCSHYITKKQKLSYQDTVRSLVANLESLSTYLLGLLYPHIKGLRRQNTMEGRQTRLCRLLLQLVGEEPGHWVGVRDCFLKIYGIENGENSFRHTALVFAPQDEEWRTEIINEYSGRLIAADRYAMEFGFTGLQSFAYLLASIGLLEIAVSEDLTRGSSPFDTLDYMRLTPLGSYALGLTNDYEPPQQEQVAYFELDPNRLIIRSLRNPNPYAQLLLDTSVSISRDRYQTSAQSFLASCHRRSDVEDKISIFRQFISNQLPPLWEQFFQQLLQHCHPLKEDHTGYKRYLLQPDDHQLIQLITTDPVLRQLVVRAEGFRIMVKTVDLKKFELELKKHGYLL